MPNDILNIPGSASADVRVWLYDQFTQYMTPDPLSPDSELLICYDEPGPNQPDDIVVIGEVTRAIEFSAFVGNGSAGYMSERFTIAIQIDVYRGGDDAPAVHARARLLADTVIAIVRNDLTAGGNVLKSDIHSDNGHGTWDAGHMGRHWLQEVELSFFKRI
jgi:hypothetical protein